MSEKIVDKVLLLVYGRKALRESGMYWYRFLLVSPLSSS